jgi:Homeodomain-like domain
MPWKERSVVEERMRFVLRLKDRESMASLCREFGISRVTGYKIYERYKECGLEGLTDRARTPYRYANKLPAQLEAMIVTMRREKPTWGARKLRDRLLRKLPTMSGCRPAAPSMPSWTAMDWLLGKDALAQKPKVLLYRRAFSECFVVHRLQRRVHAGR